MFDTTLPMIILFSLIATVSINVMALSVLSYRRHRVLARKLEAANRLEDSGHGRI